MNDHPGRLLLRLCALAWLAMACASVPAVAREHARTERAAVHDVSKNLVPVLAGGIATAGISSYTLANGFKLILAPYPGATTTTVMLTVKTGSKHEGYGETGMAHLLEHMLFKRTPKRPDIKAALTAIGADFNGFTTSDRTSYVEQLHADTAGEKLRQAIAIEADRLMNASFTREDLAREMTVVRNELERNANKPSTVLYQDLVRAAWNWHGYGHAVIGEVSDIEGAPFENLRAFYKRNYRPDNAFLVVSGKFDAARTLRDVTRAFGNLRNPQTPVVSTWTREPAQSGERLYVERRAAGKVIVMAAWKLPGAADAETIAAEIGMDALFDDRAGRVHKELVLARKVAESAEGGVDSRPEGSLAMAQLSATKDSDPMRLLDALTQIVESSASQGLPVDDIERAKTQAINAFERLRTDSQRLVYVLSENEVAGDWRLMFARHDVIVALDARAVNDALRKWIVATNRSAAILYPTQTTVTAPKVPPPADAATLVANKIWPTFASDSEPAIGDPALLAQAVQKFDLMSGRDIVGRASIMKRKTNGDLVWLSVRSGYGNEQALEGQRSACAAADALIGIGGGGLTPTELNDKLEALQAKFAVGLGSLDLEVPRKNLLSAFSLLTAAWRAPAFPEDEFESLKRSTAGAVETARKDPSAVAGKNLALALDRHPKGSWLHTGTWEEDAEAIKALTLAQVRDCYQRFSGMQAVRIGAAGDIDEETVIDLWSRLSDWRSMTPYRRVADPAYEVAGREIFATLEERPNTVIRAASVFAMDEDDPDYPALRIAILALGGDSQSRLWKRLRERDGLSYSVASRLNASVLDHRARFSLSAIVANTKASDARAALSEELMRALRQGYSTAEIEDAKRRFFEAQRLYLANERAYADLMASAIETHHDFAWIAAYNRRIAAVDAQAASAAIKKWIKPEAIVWSVAGGKP